MNIKDYLGTKTAVYCKTFEEFESIIELCVAQGVRSSLDKRHFNNHDEVCISLEEKLYLSYSRIGYFEEDDYDIINASEFLNISKELNYDIF